MTHFDIPWAKPCLGNKEKAYLSEFPRRMRASFGLAVSSGTAALQLAVTTLGLKAGDEVVIPGFSFAAVANAVILLLPSFADLTDEEIVRVCGLLQKAVE